MNAPKIDHCTETDNIIKEIINLYLFISDRIPQISQYRNKSWKK